MLNIDGILKNIYRTDRLPASFETSHKTLTLYFPDFDLTITNNRIVSESFSLTESICSSDDLEFGSCEASQVKLTVANLEQDLSGYEFVLTQIVNDTYTMPLGIYKVYSCKKQDAQWFREIVAYDRMKETDIDVAEWYNGLFQNGNETYTLKQFRENLLDYIGIEYEDENLPNDDITIEKTIDAGQLSAREVLRCCTELQGAFGQINRLGKFCHKVLQPAYGLYPTEDLYPAEDLYPVAENDTSYSMPPDETITNSMMGANGVRYEEYAVKEIDKVIIRSEEDDIGAIVGTGSNAYIIQGNFLVFGKTAGELEQIARNTYGNMAKRPYRPYRAEIIGLPYIEQGDCLEFSTGSVRGYVLQRTLKGIQALMDDIEASGSEEREQNFGVNTEIIQLKGRTTRIKKDVEGVRVEVENLEKSTNTRFEQTDQAISAEAARAIDAETILNGRIDVMAGKVVLKVDANGNVAAVELDADPSQGTNIKIKADNIQLEGLVTANGNFKVLPDGSMEAVNGKFSGELVAATGTFSGTLSAGVSITSPTINGGTITGSTLERTVNWSGTTVDLTKIDDNGFFQYVGGSATFQVGYYYQNGYIYSDGSGIQMGASGSALSINQYGVYINGSTPITSANIGSQDVYSLGGTVYVSANGNFRPFNSGGSSCGTADGKWSSVWAVNGTIQTSDEREKTDIHLLEEDERFLRFAKMIAPYTFKMVNGTSGRKHIGFIAQRIEEAMIDCGISSMEFAGLIKSPVYAKRLKDEEGNDIDEYDTTSEIVDYSYNLRYDEFIPLLFLWLRSLDSD